jgi:hypothetical protein
MSVLALACEDPPRAGPAVDAAPSTSAAPVAAPLALREGCTRVGSIDALESDPSCVLRQPADDVMRTSMRHLAIAATLEPAEVLPGGSALVTITVRNTSSSETLVVFEARSRPPGPRPDWSRVVGIPEQRSTGPESPRLFFPITTTDASNRDVDAVPIVAGSTPVPAPPTALGVHLRPGGTLTHTSSWWALQIPAAAPVWKDDAGHRYYPKTAALPLAVGEYSVVVEVPLFGLTREERRFAARVRVVRAAAPDGGTR